MDSSQWLWEYLGEKSSDFDEILYTAAELDERHVIRNEKAALNRLKSSTERISCVMDTISNR